VLGAELLLGCVARREARARLCTRTTNGGRTRIDTGPVLEKYWGSVITTGHYLERRYQSWNSTKLGTGLSARAVTRGSTRLTLSKTLGPELGTALG
jgi:hypothetical protein